MSVCCGHGTRATTPPSAAPCVPSARAPWPATVDAAHRRHRRTRPALSLHAQVGGLALALRDLDLDRRSAACTLPAVRRALGQPRDEAIAAGRESGEAVAALQRRLAAHLAARQRGELDLGE